MSETKSENQPGWIDVFGPKVKPLTVAESSDDRLLGVIPAFESWMADLGFRPWEYVYVDSLVAQVGMTVAGMGLAVLPYACFSSMFSSGLLRKVTTEVPLEPVAYRIYMRGGMEDGVIGKAAEIISSVCDYSQSFEISVGSNVPV